MNAAPRPGRNKIALLQSRKSKKQSLFHPHDFPEDIAHLVGTMEYWMRAFKAFRWHDSQLDIDPDHAITRHGFSVLLGFDYTQSRRTLNSLLRRHGATGQISKDVYLWRQMRSMVVKELLKKCMNELLELSFTIPLSQATA